MEEGENDPDIDLVLSTVSGGCDLRLSSRLPLQHCVAVIVKPNYPQHWEPRHFTEVSIPALLKDIDTLREPSPHNWTLFCSRDTKD